MEIGPRTHEGASLMISQPKLPIKGLERLREITKVYTRPEDRKKGQARWLMCEVCVEADETQTVLMLEVDPYEDGPLDRDGLELFYRKFGFKTIQREPTVLMARQPR